MKIAALIARSLLGLAFVIFGLNMFHSFIPQPPLSGLPLAFFTVMAMQSHFMLVVAFFQILGGLCTLSGRFTPLGLTILGAIGINILTYHITLDAPGLGMALVFAVIELFCVYAYRANFAGIFGPAVLAE
jgi:putative oxidoreductase